MTSPTPSEPRTGQQLYHGAPLTPALAAGLTAIAVGTIYLIQIVLSLLGALDLVASMVSDAVVIAGVLAFARRRGLRLADLGLRRVPGRFLAAAGLVGIAMWYVTALVVELIQPPGDPGKLQQFVEQTPLVPTLVALTLFPVIAEELVFRGVLVRALAGRFRPWTAIVIAAGVFGIYHLFPPQVVSTFVLALALGFLTLRSGSIVPSMIVHLLNNAIAVVLSRDELPAVGHWISTHGAIALAIALVCVASGLALAAKAVA